MLTFTIYVIDDEQTIRDGVTLTLEADYRVKSFPTAEPAIDALATDPADLILLDVGLPGMNGIEALRQIKSSNPDILVIMITAYEDVDTVISAMKLGAYDYVIKPIHMDGLEVTIRNALDSIRLKKEIQQLQEKHLKENIPCFIRESNAIQDVMDFVQMVAQSPDTPVLIMGETGTGKELIASAIHYSSPNFKAPFATVNCAAIPKDLIESELFGYEKGAFSGAGSSGKQGLIEESANGTLFLDEVGDLSLEAQAKLLRFLELGEFYRVGGTKKMHIKTRLISATNKDLNKMITDGLFRKDLYFRLGVIKVQIPSLNERPDDIIPLAKYFLQQFSDKFGKSFAEISAEAQDALLTHDWTGNVRELKNIIEAAVLTAKGPKLSFKKLGLDSNEAHHKLAAVKNEIGPEPLPPEGVDLAERLQAFERHYIEQALKMAKGNESKAARLLNMNHHTFRYRRKKLFQK
ncbi:MAG: sigma-54-dependent Fis family transcriptional regulator [Deltaproteobacteria bacterium]|jgi:DNA-binding NtrC family response regulator|nr:sigma-54-dependent Fis family transcriptional regulator [Deltaproteobacteria bacterium]